MNTSVLGKADVRWLPDEAAKARLFEVVSRFGLGTIGQSAGYLDRDLLERSSRQFLARILPPLQGPRQRSEGTGPELVRWREAFGSPVGPDDTLEDFLGPDPYCHSTWSPLDAESLPLDDLRSLVRVLQRFTEANEPCHFYWWSGGLDSPESEAHGWHVAEGTLSSFVGLAEERRRRRSDPLWFVPTLWWGGRQETNHGTLFPSWMVCAHADSHSVYVAGWSDDLLKELLAAPGLEALDATKATVID